MPEPAGLRGLLSELRRRRVFRVAGVYAVVAWAIIEVADTLLPRLALPEWTVTLVIALLLLGFPIALVLAWAFDLTPAGIKRTEASPANRESLRLTARRSVWFGLGLLVALTGAWFALDRGGEVSDAGLDGNLVAVLPFRVAGADPQLAYLREGMLDLLATKLTGEGGPRAVDPRSLMSAWARVAGEDGADLPPDSARLLARRLGAGLLVLGELVSTPGGLVLSASLHRVESGHAEQPVSVEGPVDSLPALVDRLAAALLSVEAGESERLASLTSTSLPALRAYLDGQALYRHARYTEAEQHYARALELDSTFALAAIGRYQAATWRIPARVDRAALALAWAHRDRLSPRDRAFLVALAGPRYPAPSTVAEELAAWEQAVEQMPDRAEAWFQLGDVIIHFGPLIDMERHHERAEAALQRAAELDPGFAAAIQHLADLAAQRRDSAAYVRYSGRYLALEPEEVYAGAGPWTRGVLFGDTAARRVAREALGAATPPMVRAVMLSAVTSNGGYDLADDLAREALDRARTADERRSIALALHDYALNRGRPGRALELTRALVDPANPRSHLRQAVEDALFAGGDSAAAAAAARELAGAPELRWRERCALEQWRVRHGELDAAAAGAATLRRTAGAGGEAAVGAALCADLVEVLWAAAAERPDAPARLARLDSVLATGPEAFPIREQANLTVARLWAAQGRSDAALRAARRRMITPGGELYFAERVLEQARAAARSGRRDEAIASYQHYLALRSDPEPSVGPRVEQARGELTALVGER